MKESEQEKQARRIKSAREESDMEWILAGLLIILITAISTI